MKSQSRFRAVFVAIAMALSLTSTMSFAKDLSMLYIGNSYTYLEGIGHEDDPAVPKLVREIAHSIDPTLNLAYAFRTIGGASLATHLNDAKSMELMAKHYDKVVVQGQSMESLELTPWWIANGNPGAKGFRKTLPQVLEILKRNNNDISLYVHWGKHPKNEVLAENHPGLYFPPGSARAGQKWCGRDKFEYQALINAGYARAAQGYAVNFAKIGDAWISLQQKGIVGEEELYRENDWSHASLTGGYIAALVIARDVLKMDLSKNRFIPDGISAEKAAAIQQAMTK